MSRQGVSTGRTGRTPSARTVHLKRLRFSLSRPGRRFSASKGGYGGLGLVPASCAAGRTGRTPSTVHLKRLRFRLSRSGRRFSAFRGIAAVWGLSRQVGTHGVCPTRANCPFETPAVQPVPVRAAVFGVQRGCGGWGLVPASCVRRANRPAIRIRWLLSRSASEPSSCRHQLRKPPGVCPN